MSITVSSLAEAVKAAFALIPCDDVLSDGVESWNQYDLLSSLPVQTADQYEVLEDGTILLSDSLVPLYRPAHHEKSGTKLQRLMDCKKIARDVFIQKTADSVGANRVTVKKVVDDILDGQLNIRNIPYRLGLAFAVTLNVSPMDLL